MQFRTELNLQPSANKITLSAPVLSMGSCFADCFGLRLRDNKFPVLSNPFGVIFNPLSLFSLIQNSIYCKVPDDWSYIINNGVWYNYSFHSDLSEVDKEVLKEKVRFKIIEVNRFVKEAKYLVLTFGTAFVYELVDTGEVVANCHKLPSGYFSKRLLKVDEIVNNFKNFYAVLTNLNPDIKLILTVSPIRHIKDSLELNTVSKSVLRLAIEEMKLDHQQVEYFPSYELLLDDLRDYRFYKSDMIHPNEIAENYIWEKFSEKYFDTETQSFINEWQRLKKAVNHKAFHPESEAHKQFLGKTLDQLNRLSSKVDVRKEIEEINKRYQISNKK